VGLSDWFPIHQVLIEVAFVVYKRNAHHWRGEIRRSAQRVSGQHPSPPLCIGMEGSSAISMEK
jgi:hypothetical protein